jgi:hypothetical protein
LSKVSVANAIRPSLEMAWPPAAYGLVTPATAGRRPPLARVKDDLVDITGPGGEVTLQKILRPLLFPWAGSPTAMDERPMSPAAILYAPWASSIDYCRRVPASPRT